MPNVSLKPAAVRYVTGNSGRLGGVVSGRNLQSSVVVSDANGWLGKAFKVTESPVTYQVAAFYNLVEAPTQIRREPE